MDASLLLTAKVAASAGIGMQAFLMEMESHLIKKKPGTSRRYPAIFKFPSEQIASALHRPQDDLDSSAGPHYLRSPFAKVEYLAEHMYSTTPWPTHVSGVHGND